MTSRDLGPTTNRVSRIAAQLRESGIQPSAQRLAVAEYVLDTTEHPSAEDVLQRVLARFPMVSRATVYNTLNLFVAKGLLRHVVLSEGCVRFDPNTEPHHHFVDEADGRIHDVPWEALDVHKVDQLSGFEVTDYQVVLRGRRRAPRSRGRKAS